MLEVEQKKEARTRRNNKHKNENDNAVYILSQGDFYSWAYPHTHTDTRSHTSGLLLLLLLVLAAFFRFSVGRVFNFIWLVLFSSARLIFIENAGFSDTHTQTVQSGDHKPRSFCRSKNSAQIIQHYVHLVRDLLQSISNWNSNTQHTHTGIHILQRNKESIPEQQYAYMCRIEWKIRFKSFHQRYLRFSFRTCRILLSIEHFVLRMVLCIIQKWWIYAFIRNPL